MPQIYAGLLNQYKCKHQKVFSVSYDKQDADEQILDEIDWPSNLNINRKLTQSYIDNIDCRSELEQMYQSQESKISGWRFDKINSMTKYFYKTPATNGSK